MSNYSGLLSLNFRQEDINKINPEDKDKKKATAA